MKTVIIIPARYKSSRFPGKPLTLILGKEMILWVAELCSRVISTENIYVATEDFRIKNTVEKAGFNVIMTSDTPLTGTDRLAEAANQIEADIYINVQGDEPLINPSDILRVIEAKKVYPNDVIKGFCKISDDENPEDINIPKVIFTEDHKMVYMSRQLIPGSKVKKNKPKHYYKAVCIYAFSKKDLNNYANFERKSTLELHEDIEILRFLDIGTTVRLIETQKGSLAVDIPSDVARVESEILKNKNYHL
jgi:3-deoxy-manno-octulosonate cytidylyltransferase (CMP-KDO synthetase)